MVKLVTGLAPNLHKVVILNLSLGGFLRSNLPRGSWQYLPGSLRGKGGSLESLWLRGYARLTTPKMLQDCVTHIDSTRLRHLTLGKCLDMRQSGISGETME
jgi:hypothetical protein